MHTGVDVGGTFTDVAVWDGDRLRTAKVPTTVDQSDGVISGIEEIDAEPGTLLHGTTVATNALLERSGAATVLVTDEGFAPQPVSLGLHGETHVEILEGLSVGDQYVSQGGFTLKAELGKEAFGDGHGH